MASPSVTTSSVSPLLLKIGEGESGVKNRRGTFSKTLLFRKERSQQSFPPELLKHALQQTAKKSRSNLAKEGPRTFKAQEVEYEIPNILPPDDGEEDKDEVPVFLGDDGTLYNKSYHIIKNHPWVREVVEDDSNKSYQVRSDIWVPFPDEEKYENFFDFEQAVMDWRKQLEKQIANVQVPMVLGRYYSRPKAISRKRSDSADDTDDTMSVSSEILGESLADTGLSRAESTPDMTSLVLEDNLVSGGNSPVESASPVSINMRSRAGSVSSPFGGSALPSPLPIRQRSSSVTWKDEAEKQPPALHLPAVSSAPTIANLDKKPLSMSTPSLTVKRNTSSPSLPAVAPKSNSATASLRSPRSPLSSSSSSTSSLLSLTGPLSSPSSSNPSSPSSRPRLEKRTSEPELRKTGMEGDSVDEDQLYMSNNPWESVLIPVEPSPRIYTTFDEYENALRRWAYEVVSHSEFLPPHASQLQDIINLTPAKNLNFQEVAKKETTTNTTETSMDMNGWAMDNRIRTGLVAPQILEALKNMPHGSDLSQKNWMPVQTPLPLDNSVTKWKQLAPKTKRLLIEHIDSLQRHADDAIHHYSITPNPPKQRKTSSATLSNTISILPPSPPFPQLLVKSLKRADLNPSKANTESIPDPDIGLNCALLSNRNDAPSAEKVKGYIRFARQQVQRVDHMGRHDLFYSWSHPTCSYASHVLPQEITTIVSNCVTSKTFPFAITTTPLFLDKFQDFLLSRPPFPQSSSYIDLITSLITFESWVQLLGMINTHNSPSVHAKVAMLVWGILGVVGDKGRELVEALINKKDILSLYYLAELICFFDDVPCDIFLYDPLFQLPLVTKVIPKSKELFETVFIVYYSEIILDKLQVSFPTLPPIILDKYQADSSPFKFLRENLIASISTQKESIGSFLLNNFAFLSIGIWLGLGNRSPTVSTISLFCFLRLLRSSSNCDSIVTALKDPKTDLIGCLRGLAGSKFTHSLFAAKRIFHVLQEDPFWEQFLFNEYMREKLLIEDLTLQSQKSEAHSLSTLVLEMCLNVLDKAVPSKNYCLTSGLSNSNTSNNNNSNSLSVSPQKERKSDEETPLGYLSSRPVFQDIFNGILKSAKNLSYKTETLAILFEKLCRTLFRLNMIDAVEDIKSNKKEKPNPENIKLVTLSPADIQQLINFIHGISSFDKYKIKTAMLKALTHLLKFNKTFEFVKKETGFYIKLTGYCRDNQSVIFNRASWGMFYQLIRYHPASIETLEKLKVLIQFLDIIGIGSSSAGKSSIAMTNSLRYLYKLFTMYDHEQKLLASGRFTPRTDLNLKSVLSDAKFLSSLFVQRHLFIKTHMVYKRLVGKEQGESFIMLANLYHIFGNDQTLHKILKDAQKNPEYKEELSYMCSLFVPPTL